MSEERTTPEAMLAHALGELEAAEAWQRMVTAVFEHHQELGGTLWSLRNLSDMRDAGVADAARLDAMTLEAAPMVAGAFWHFASWLGGSAPRRPGCDLRAALRRAAPPGAVSLPSAALRVALDEAEADDLAARLAGLAVADASRELRARPYRRWALVQVLGTASGDLLGHLSVKVATDGLAGAAGGMLLLPGHGRPEVAECWLPLAPEPEPEGPFPGPRVAWAEPKPVHRVLLSRFAGRAGRNLDLYPTNAALLEADANGPYDAVVLSLHDETTPAAEARARLLERRPRGVALAGACEHEGGPLGAHGADPALFGPHFARPYKMQEVHVWLQGLHADGPGPGEAGDASA